jgi:hypothetical protein
MLIESKLQKISGLNPLDSAKNKVKNGLYGRHGQYGRWNCKSLGDKLSIPKG